MPVLFIKFIFKQTGYQIGDLQAFDADEGANSQITYSIEQSNTDSFHVDKNTGILKLASSFDKACYCGKFNNKRFIVNL